MDIPLFDNEFIFFCDIMPTGFFSIEKLAELWNLLKKENKINEFYMKQIPIYINYNNEMERLRKERNKIYIINKDDFKNQNRFLNFIHFENK